MQASEITSKKLQQFGIVCAVFTAGLFGLILPWLRGTAQPLWPWIVGTLLLVLAIIVPISLKALYKVSLKAGYLLGVINNNILLVFIYFLVLYPLALVRKAMKYNSLALNIEKDTESYRVQVQARNLVDMEKPF
jgi:hypothetical protein